MYENWSLFRKNNQKGNIIERKVKLKRQKKTLSYRVQEFLKWLDLKNEIGENLITEDTIISEVFSYWSKEIIVWFFQVFLTGTLIFLAILPFYSIPFKLIPFFIFSIGLIYYLTIEALKEIVGVIKHG